MRFNAESGRKAKQRRAGLASWRARVSKLGLAHFQQWARSHGPGRSYGNRDGQGASEQAREHESTQVESLVARETDLPE